MECEQCQGPVVCCLANRNGFSSTEFSVDGGSIPRQLVARPHSRTRGVPLAARDQSGFVLEFFTLMTKESFEEVCHQDFKDLFYSITR